MNHSEVSMGIVDTMRQKKGAMTGAAIGFVFLAAVSMAYQLWPQKHYSSTLTYFSDDDGNTWFLDSVDNVPPYDHDGKQAVRAVIYSYDNGSKKFCGYLMRFGPSVEKSVQAAIVAGAKKQPPETPQGIMNGIEFNASWEVKKPNSTDPWFRITSPKAQEALQVKSPDGSILDSVLP
jgi:hypothetical protein